MNGDNGPMEVTPEDSRRIEEELAALDALDPADVPEPAARLADLLGRLLDPPDEGSPTA